MRIGILQCGRAPEHLVPQHGDYDTMFERLLCDEDISFVTYKVLDSQLPDRIDAADGWLITGSRFGVYEDHAWIAPLEVFLREAYAAAVPIVGICFGHQILAQAFGGRVEKYSGGWSVGPVEYSTEREGTVRLVAFHQDQIVNLPPGATPTGFSACCPYAFLAYGKRALSMQAHPEFTPAFLDDLLAARGVILPEDVLRRARENEGMALDSLRIAEEIKRFFRARCIGVEKRA